MKQPITRRVPLADSFSRGLEIIRLQAQVQAKSVALLAQAILLIGVLATIAWVWFTVDTQILLGAARSAAAWAIVDGLKADFARVPVLTEGGTQHWSLRQIHADPWHHVAFAETWAAMQRAAAVCMALAIPASVAAFWGAYKRGQNAAASLLARGQKVVDERDLARLVRSAGGVSRFTIGTVPLPSKALNRSIMFLGAPQTGKSLSMKRWLRQVRERGDMAIVFDKVGDVTGEFYDPARGDIILNPLDARSPDWSPWAEMRTIEDAYRLSKSLIPSVPGENNFFHVGAQDVFATMLLRIARLPKRSLLGLLEAALVLDKKGKAELLARTAAAKHYEGDHRSGHDVDATMAVFTQALRFLRATAGGPQDFSIRDFITDTVTRLEKPDGEAIAEIRARFAREMAQLHEARNLLATGALRKAFKLVARISVAFPLLPDGLTPPQPEDDHAAWWSLHRARIEAHWRDQDATMPEHLASLEAHHNTAAQRLKRKGPPWLFIGSTQRQIHAVRPVLSLWLDAVADTIMSLPDNRDRRIWLMLDELQSLQQLPSLQPLLTEGAKYGVCVCAGVQNMGQIRQSYGRDAAEVILSLFNTKAFFRLQEPDTAHWAERAIGSAVKEHVHESIRLATSQTMDGASMSVSRTTEPIVMAGEIIRLNDLHCYLMLPGDWPVGKITLRFDARRDAPPAIAPALIPQRAEDTIYHALDNLGWNPLPTGADGDDPGSIARTVAGSQATSDPPHPPEPAPSAAKEAAATPPPRPEKGEPAATEAAAAPPKQSDHGASPGTGTAPDTPKSTGQTRKPARPRHRDLRPLDDPRRQPPRPAAQDRKSRDPALERPPLRGVGADLMATMHDRPTHQLPLPLPPGIASAAAGGTSAGAQTGWRRKAGDPRTQTAQGRSRRHTATKELG